MRLAIVYPVRGKPAVVVINAQRHATDGALAVLRVSHLGSDAVVELGLVSFEPRPEDQYLRIGQPSVFLVVAHVVAD